MSEVHHKLLRWLGDTEQSSGDLGAGKADENLEEEEDGDGTRETNQRVVHPYNDILPQK
jgi:hypothetical protein